MHASSLHHLKSLLLDGSVQKGPIVFDKNSFVKIHK